MNFVKSEPFVFECISQTRCNNASPQTTATSVAIQGHDDRDEELLRLALASEAVDTTAKKNKKAAKAKAKAAKAKAKAAAETTPMKRRSTKAAASTSKSSKKAASRTSKCSKEAAASTSKESTPRKGGSQKVQMSPDGKFMTWKCIHSRVYHKAVRAAIAMGHTADFAKELQNHSSRLGLTRSEGVLPARAWLQG